MKRISKSIAVMLVLGMLTACGKTAVPGEDTAAVIIETDSAEETMAAGEKAIEEADGNESEETAIQENIPESEATSDAPIEVTVQPFVSGAQYAESDGQAEPISIEQISEEENHVSWAEDWMKENQLFLPILSESARGFYDETYRYHVSDEGIDIYDKATERPLYAVSFPEGIADTYGIWAKLEDGILYTNQFFNGYAMPDTAYIMAIDLGTGNILWRSKDQSCNSRNFLVKGDVILCGYGFTAEDDYLYQIDKHTGRVIAKTDVASMADYLIEQDGKLYVHTYNRDYVFNVN